MTEPPLSPERTQWSDDGATWWDGSAWIPREQVPQRQAELEREHAARLQEQQAAYARQYAEWQAQQAQQAQAVAESPFAAPGTTVAPPPPPPAPEWAAPDATGPRPSGYALGMWSFVAALAGLILWGIGGITAIVLGHLSRKQAREARLAPNVWSRWGLFFGYLEIAALGALVALAVWALTSLDHGPIGASLHTAARAEDLYHGAYGSYARTMGELAPTRFRAAPGVEVSIAAAGRSSYCLRGQKGSTVLWLSSSSGKVSRKPCI